MRYQFSIAMVVGLLFITTTVFAQNYQRQRPQRTNPRAIQNNNNNNSLLKADGMNQHQEQQNRQDLGKSRAIKQQQENQQDQQSSQSGSVM